MQCNAIRNSVPFSFTSFAECKLWATFFSTIFFCHFLFLLRFAFHRPSLYFFFYLLCEWCEIITRWNVVNERKKSLEILQFQFHLLLLLLYIDVKLSYFTFHKFSESVHWMAVIWIHFSYRFFSIFNNFHSVCVCRNSKQIGWINATNDHEIVELKYMKIEHIWKDFFSFSIEDKRMRFSDWEFGILGIVLRRIGFCDPNVAAFFFIIIERKRPLIQNISIHSKNGQSDVWNMPKGMKLWAIALLLLLKSRKIAIKEQILATNGVLIDNFKRVSKPIRWSCPILKHANGPFTSFVPNKDWHTLTKS